MDYSSISYTHTLDLDVLEKNFSFWKITVLVLEFIIYTCLTKTILDLNVKNIDISSCMCSGSYPYTLCFKSVFEISYFCIWRSFEKINLEKYSFCFIPKFLSYKNSSKCL